MNTLGKFRDAVDRITPATVLTRFGTLLVGLGFCLLVLYGPDMLPTKPRWLESAGILVTLAGLFTMFLVLGVGAWLNERRVRKDPRLICPHCNRSLLPHSALVIATRNCPHCGARVLAD